MGPQGQVIVYNAPPAWSKNSQKLPNHRGSPYLYPPGIHIQIGVKIPNMQKPLQAGKENNPRFYLYKMTVDDGGAPCVQDRMLTLAICKPTIRRVAPEGRS